MAKTTVKKKTSQNTAEKTGKRFREQSFTMTQIRETPGTFVYAQLDDNDDVIENVRETVLGQVYLQKSILNGAAAPKRIFVTVAAE